MTCICANAPALPADIEGMIHDLHRLSIATDQLFDAFLDEFKSFCHFNITRPVIGSEQQIDDLLNVIGANVFAMRNATREVRSALYLGDAA